MVSNVCPKVTIRNDFNNYELCLSSRTLQTSCLKDLLLFTMAGVFLLIPNDVGYLSSI